MAGRPTIRLWSAIILIWIAGALSAFSQTRQIVLLYDERVDLPGLALLDAGFTRALTSGSPDHVEIYREEMDLSRFDSPGYQDLLRNEFRAKYAAKKIDLVVAVMAPAVDFLLSHRDEIFPGTPIVFCGLDRKQLGNRSLPSNVTGVLVKREFSPTLDLVVRLHPDTERIVVVAGKSEFDARLLAQAREEFKPFEKRFAFTYLTNFPLPEMLSRLSKLPPKTVILYTTMFRDGAGQPYVPHEVAERISAAANAPLYGFVDQYVGHGIVGGQVYGLGLHGEEAAGLVLKILSGRKPQQLSPIEPANTVMMFDARQLQRWKINEHRLPAESTVLFRQPTVWDRYRTWIIGGISICILQALLIAGLVANLIRRRRAEGSLVESEGRFQVMADAAPVLIWMAGPDKLCTFFNQAWLDFTGRTMKQECGNGWSEGVHPDDLEKCMKQYDTSFDAREPFLMQYRLQRKNGDYRWVTDSGVPRYDAAGSFLGYIGACVDVTELEEKENALRAFEQRVTLAAEAAHLGVWELDTKTKDIWMSDAARKLFHFDPEELVSYRSFIDRVHPEDRSKREAALQRAIDTEGGGYDMEFRALLPNGTIRWISGRTRSVSRGASKSSRLVGVSMDVTERKQAEQLFQLATESSPTGILLVNDQRNIILVNAYIEHLFGYRRDELMGKTIKVLLPELFKNGRNDIGNAYAETSTARPAGISQELFGRRRDGSEFPVEIGLSSIQTSQGILVLATVVDISVRKAAEEEVRRRREQIELLSRISLLGEMTASIAHELNQPLSAILSNASAGQRFIDKGNAEPAGLREILVDVAADARRAHDIMQNIRNTIKKGAEVRQRIDLNQVVTSVTHLIQATATAHECEMKISLAKNLPEIEGDPIQIQQVLVNLVNNAIEAMSGIAVPNRKVEITTWNGQDSVSVSIRDHGVGIPNDARARLFDQFFTTKEDGLGMGLAIVRSIIETHGGRIAAENAENGGARFYFSMPAAKLVRKCAA